MFFKKESLQQLQDSHIKLRQYYHELRNFYEMIDTRLASAEYGVKLKCVTNSKLFTNNFGFHLYDETSSPFYLWLPSWFGRCYVNQAVLPEGVPIGKCQARDAKYMAFVWSWLGLDDAFLKDAEEPECWIGVAEPDSDNPSDTLYNVAHVLFYSFRSERTTQDESDGWLRGSFYKNVDFNLNGHWFLKKVPLSQLTSFYQIENLIIRPVVGKFHELTVSSKLEEELANGHPLDSQPVTPTSQVPNKKVHANGYVE